MTESASTTRSYDKLPGEDMARALGYTCWMHSGDWSYACYVKENSHVSLHLRYDKYNPGMFVAYLQYIRLPWTDLRTPEFSFPYQHFGRIVNWIERIANAIESMEMR